jgi:chromate reductase
LKLLGLSGSLRRDSFHTRLLTASAALLPEGIAFAQHDYRTVPFYDGDLAVPPEVEALNEAIRAADVVLIATPEYNHSVPGVLKNALDWSSRPAFASVWVDKPVGLFSASPGAVGGVRAQAHLREILVGMLARVYPARELSFGGVKTLFDGDRLVDPTATQRLERYVRGLVDWAGA